jgi:hypothetical protein
VAHLLSAVSSLLVGVILVIAPWWPSLWDANVLLQPYPLLRSVVLSAFTRGAVSGLGLVNVLLAFQEVREHFMGSDHPKDGG